MNFYCGIFVYVSYEQVVGTAIKIQLYKSENKLLLKYD